MIRTMIKWSRNGCSPRVSTQRLASDVPLRTQGAMLRDANFIQKWMRSPNHPNLSRWIVTRTQLAR